MLAGMVFLVAGLMLMPLHPTIGYLLIPMALLAIGQGLANPCILSLISRAVGGDVQGNVLGTNQSMSAMARIVGPIFAGLVYDLLSAQWTFWAGGLVMIGCLAFAFAVRGRFAPAAEVKS